MGLQKIRIVYLKLRHDQRNRLGTQLDWTELLAAASFRLYFPKYFLSFSTITTVLYTTIIILVGERERERDLNFHEISLSLSCSLQSFIAGIWSCRGAKVTVLKVKRLVRHLGQAAEQRVLIWKRLAVKLLLLSWLLPEMSICGTDWDRLLPVIPVVHVHFSETGL